MRNDLGKSTFAVSLLFACISIHITGTKQLIFKNMVIRLIEQLAITLIDTQVIPKKSCTYDNHFKEFFNQMNFLFNKIKYISINGLSICCWHSMT
jgi:hypothetical protein